MLASLAAGLVSPWSSRAALALSVVLGAVYAFWVYRGWRRSIFFVRRLIIEPHVFAMALGGAPGLALGVWFIQLKF